jgi:ABC-type lipoprotein release transport system permease subunit
MKSAMAQARVAALLARHLLHVMARQRARVLVLWGALVVALGIGVGLLGFVTSIEDSYRERGQAVGGISDIQVKAIDRSSLPPRLAGRLGRLPGTRYAVPMTQQRVELVRGDEAVVATGIGIDRSARRLRSAVQRELRVETSGSAKPGLALTGVLARKLGGVEPGERVGIFAYGREPSLRVARIVDVDPAIEDVITLPRAQLERLRGAPGRPTIVYVKLAAGASVESWERRAREILPPNATLTTAAADQAELNHVLDFTVRAPTFVFGLVVLSIAALLIYVLQLMRMLERQEDMGLLRGLGSKRAPLILAEGAILAVLLVAAIPPGVLVGTPIAHYLAAQVPTFLTDVFGFNMQVAVRPGSVAIAAAVALAVGIAATVGALASARGSIAEQLGRSPQAGATVTSTISLRSALALVAGGAGCLAVGLLLSDGGLYAPSVVTVLIGLALGTPGVVGLAAIALGRGEGGGTEAVLVARGAIEANPRRAALAAAIMALGIAAVIPPQLSEHALVERKDALVEAIRPDAQELVASEDSFYSVPITPRFGRQALRDPAGPADPVVFAFVAYRGRKVELRAVDPHGFDGVLRPGIGLPQSLPKLRRNPDGVLISRVMAAGLDLGAGDTIALDTVVGPRRLEVLGEVEDVAWPSGTIYMDISRYRQLFRTGAISVLAVRRPGMIDRGALARLGPLHILTGDGLLEKIDEQMDKSTQGLRAMRVLTLLAALVAVGGIISTAVFARRREWAVLRAMGMRNGGLFAALAMETFLVMSLGAACGTIGGIVSFLGPGRAFLESQGYVIGTDLAPITVAAVVGGAVAIGTLAAAIPAWLTARAPLADALSYE